MAQLVDSIAPRGGGRQLLLVGSGHGHLQLLARLAAQPLAGVQVTLVAPLARQFCSAMLPGFVAGDYTLADCAVELAPLLRHAAVRSHQGRVVRLDAQARSLQLADGSTLGYDWLSLDPGPMQDRDRIERAIPGAREHGLFVRPIEAFGALWPRVTAMAPERLRSLAVIGSGVTGIELAMAIRQRVPQAAITLVAGGVLAGPACPAALRKRIARALQKRAITVLPDVACALRPGEVVLGCGARLACDVPLVALGRKAPEWLAGSGLALDPAGCVAVDACQRSTSHPDVFASGDASSGAAHPAARHGLRMLRCASALADSLAAVASGAPPVPCQPARPGPDLLALGEQVAIASWGPLSVQGHWVWRCKDWRDRRWVDRLRPAGG